MPPAQSIARTPRPWLGFTLDVLLAGALIFGVTMLGVVAWSAWRAFRVAAGNPALAKDQQALMQAIGEPGMVLMLVLSSVSMLVAAVVLHFWRRRASRQERRESLAAARRPRTWWAAIGLGVGLFAASSALMAMLERIGHLPEPTNLAMLEAAMAYSPLLLLVVAGVMAPLFEELLFRRVLFGRLWAAGKPLAGMLASSALFALMHEVPGSTASPWPMTLILLAFYMTMGMAMAWIYRRTGTLWAPILAHATNNLLACGVLIAGYGS